MMTSLPPDWDQWVSLPVSAPVGGARGQGRRRHGAGRPADGVGASSSHAGPAARPEQEQEQERAGTLLAHFVEAQVGQGLW
jgi:hypothetical protein